MKLIVEGEPEELGGRAQRLNLALQMAQRARRTSDDPAILKEAIGLLSDASIAFSMPLLEAMRDAGEEEGD